MDYTNAKNDQFAPAENRKFPTVGDLLAMLGIFVAVQIVVTLVGHLALLLVEGGKVEMSPAKLGRFLALTSLVSLSVTAVLIWLYRRWRSAPKIRIGLALRGINPLLVLWCFALMMAASIALEPLYELLPTPHQNFGRGVWAFLAVVVVAPVGEEWICRGLIFGSLRSRCGVVRSMVLSALIFGLMHVQPVPVLNAFVLGLVLAFIYHKTNSLYASILLHALYNGTAYALTVAGYGERSFRSLFGEHETAYMIFYAAVLVLLVVSVFAIRRLLVTPAEKSLENPVETVNEGEDANKIEVKA